MSVAEAAADLCMGRGGGGRGGEGVGRERSKLPVGITVGSRYPRDVIRWGFAQKATADNQSAERRLWMVESAGAKPADTVDPLYLAGRGAFTLALPKNLLWVKAVESHGL